MSPSAAPARASNSTRAFPGILRSSHTPLLRPPRAQSLPAVMRHAGPSALQSGPRSARWKSSSKGAVIGGREGAAAAEATTGWGFALAELTAGAGAGFAGAAPASAVDAPSGTQATGRVHAAA